MKGTTMSCLIRRAFIMLSNHPRNDCSPLRAHLGIRNLHTNPHLHNKKQGDLAPTRYFENSKEKKKHNFLEVIRQHEKMKLSDPRYSEFILTALKYMDMFGVNKDIEVYKKIVDILPKGKYIPPNVYYSMFPYYPRQQDAVLSLLCKMEDNGLIPDHELQAILLNTFGEKSRVMQKCGRMVYWMTKFRHLSPWPVPDIMPDNPKEIATMAMHKIGTVDVQTEMKEYWTEEVEDAIDKTWILSIMSPSQKELLEVQPADKALAIEGPFPIWYGGKCIDYFVLKGPPIKREIINIDTDDVCNLPNPYEKMGKYLIPFSIHEQEEGTYFAICATGTSTKDSLLSWIRLLEKENPNLKKLPVIFKLKSAIRENMQEQLVSSEETKKVNERGAQQIQTGELQDQQSREQEQSKSKRLPTT